jgi:hypothetical protein
MILGVLSSGKIQGRSHPVVPATTPQQLGARALVTSLGHSQEHLIAWLHQGMLSTAMRLAIVLVMCNAASVEGVAVYSRLSMQSHQWGKGRCDVHAQGVGGGASDSVPCVQPCDVGGSLCMHVFHGSRYMGPRGAADACKQHAKQHHNNAVHRRLTQPGTAQPDHWSWKCGPAVHWDPARETDGLVVITGAT